MSNFPERARILLEAALAKQKGVRMADVKPINVDPVMDKGLSNYIADLNYRAINDVLTKEADQWDAVYDRWTVDDNGFAAFLDDSPKAFGNNVLRSAILAERQLRANPSLYNIASSGSQDAFQRSRELNLNERLQTAGSPHVVVQSLNPDLSQRLFELKAHSAAPVFSRYGSPLSYRDDILVRGMHFDDDGIENFKRQLKDDGEWSSNAFNSFSNDPSHAANFLARSYKNENNGVFVQVDSGIEQITARDVAHPYWADNPREQEHIYLPGTRFIVQDLLEGPEADERIKALFRERKELLLNASLEKRLLSDYARQELSRYTKKSLESGQPPNAGRNMFVSVVPVQQVIPPYPRQKREQWNADWVQLSSPDKVPERLDQKRRFENVMEFVGDLADTDWVKESIRTGREVRDAKWRAKEASIQAQLQVAKDNVTRQLFTDFPVSDFLRQRLEANPLLIPALTLNDPNTAKKYSEALDAQINLDSDIPF